MYVVTRIGNEEVECIDAENRKFYYPREQTPLVEIGDRVSGMSGPSWDLLTNVAIEPPCGVRLPAPPERIDLPVSDEPDPSLDPSSASFCLVSLEDASRVIRKLAARLATVEESLLNKQGSLDVGR